MDSKYKEQTDSISSHSEIILYIQDLSPVLTCERILWLGLPYVQVCTI